jgi:hypothetical protein
MHWVEESKEIYQPYIFYTLARPPTTQEFPSRPTTVVSA